MGILKGNIFLFIETNIMSHIKPSQAPALWGKKVYRSTLY